MSATTYALLVGIDEYPAPVNPLRGCVNDIRRVETILHARLQPATAQSNPFQPRLLLNEQATRQGMIDGFRQHLSQAQAGDVALFYYSGHGSQAPSPQEFWHLEPDRLDETLVCWDSRLPGGNQWDLADKELAQLIADVAENGAHVVIILDCCHSGSGTRAPQDPSVRERRVPTDDRLRPLESFLVSPAQATALATTDRAANGGGGWYSLPTGRHVVLSACSPEETAKELILGGEQRGAFSYYLLDTLQRATSTLTYRDLFKRVNAMVRAGVSLQSPQMEATASGDLAQPFLGGAIVDSPAYFIARYDRNLGWVIDGGAVHGLPQPSKDETTRLALFPFDADVATLRTLANAIGTASVTTLYPGQSAVQAVLHNNQSPDPQLTYKAVITALPLPPLIVALAGDEAGLALVRTALDQAGTGGPSLLVRAGAEENAELLLYAVANGYTIQRKGDAYPLVVETPTFSADSAQLVVQRLEHIARWQKIIDLTNPASRLQAEDVRLEIELPDGTGGWKPTATTAEIRLHYTLREGKWRQPTFRIKLTNTSTARLYCMAFDLTETYGVLAVFPGGGVWLDPGQETWANRGQPFYASVPKQLWEAGTVKFSDTFLLITATEESDAATLEQDDLPVTVAPVRAMRSVSHMSTLNRLMQRVTTRTISSQPEDAEEFADWVTTKVSFTTIRPQEAATIAAPGEKTTLSQGVTILGHPTLHARARLTNLPDVSRDVGNLTLPAILRDHLDVVEPFEFSKSRGGEPGLSVVELLDVQDHTAVMPETPLVVQIQAELAQDERLLPLAHDGEFFLPLGTVTRTDEGVTVTLDRLPPPTGTRSLGGSIKILFQKLVGQQLGWLYAYPQLAIATVSVEGKVDYEKDQEIVRQAIAQQSADEPIILYVHGIIGDTGSMVASAQTDWLKFPTPVAGLASRYKLLLTFDYENLHTPIEENARLLKARLAEVGLGPEHNKTLHVVAHSMGGLVARWFIEQEEGNRVVQRLVMLGTPNAGSPWPTVQDWATVALGFGLNSLSGIAWPIQSLSALAALLEKVDVSLDQMAPNSEFLTKLAASADPGIPYTIIAGNTSIIPAALQSDPNKATSLFDRLWMRLKPQRLLHTITAPVFFGQPNDIAVAVTSITHVPVGHLQAAPPIEIACDHITYFTTVAGLNELNRAL